MKLDLPHFAYDALPSFAQELVEDIGDLMEKGPNENASAVSEFGTAHSSDDDVQEMELDEAEAGPRANSRQSGTSEESDARAREKENQSPP